MVALRRARAALAAARLNWEQEHPAAQVVAAWGRWQRVVPEGAPGEHRAAPARVQPRDLDHATLARQPVVAEWRGAAEQQCCPDDQTVSWEAEVAVPVAPRQLGLQRVVARFQLGAALLAQSRNRALPLRLQAQRPPVRLPAE